MLLIVTQYCIAQERCTPIIKRNGHNVTVTVTNGRIARNYHVVDSLYAATDTLRYADILYVERDLLAPHLPASLFNGYGIPVSVFSPHNGFAWHLSHRAVLIVGGCQVKSGTVVYVVPAHDRSVRRVGVFFLKHSDNFEPPPR